MTRFPGWTVGSPRGDVRFDPEKVLLTPRDEGAIADGCYFDIPAAEKVVRFFEKYLRHSKGRWAGKPFKLLDWQKYDLVAPLFGWKRADGTRRYRTGYVEVPKKNGKSTLSSGIALYMLTADGEPGAEVYSAAADRDQASIVFNESKTMVVASQSLSKRLKVVDSRKTIAYAKTHSVYRALSADVPTKEGLNIHCLIFDELHAQKTRALWDTLRYGGAARAQPLLLSITTAGYERTSICWEQHDYAPKGAEGNGNGLVLLRAGLQHELGKRGEPERGRTGDTLDGSPRVVHGEPEPRGDDLRGRLRAGSARGNGKPGEAKHVQALSAEHLDSVGDALDSAGGVEQVRRRHRLESLSNRRCWAGLDLSSTTDLTSLSLVFEPGEDGVYDALSWSWCPEDTLAARVKRDRVPYDLWAEQGYLIPTSGNVVDYTFVMAKINALKDEYDLRILGFDRWGSTQITVALEENGLQVLPVGQGFKDMSPPTKELERLVLGRMLRHGGNPLLTWAMDNVVIVSDPAENIKPSKEKSTERIDPVVSLIISVAAMQRDIEEECPYSSRGIVVL